MANELPPEVAAAAAVVDSWLKGQPPVLAARPQEPARPAAQEPTKMTPAQRLDWARSHDQTKMPPWKDPRG
jgi:hypothetical protein